MRLRARWQALIASAKSQPVYIANATTVAISIAVGVGVPVTADLKAGIIGMVALLGSKVAHDRVVPVETLVAGLVSQSGAGAPVYIQAPSGEVQVVGATS